MSKTVLCCPYCESTDYSVRNSGRPASRDETEANYRCNAKGCRAFFDELVERESRATSDKNGKGHVHGLAKSLLDADSDEVSLS